MLTKVRRESPQVLRLPCGQSHTLIVNQGRGKSWRDTSDAFITQIVAEMDAYYSGYPFIWGEVIISYSAGTNVDYDANKILFLDL